MTFLLDQASYLKQLNLFPEPYSHAEKLIMRRGIEFFATKTFKIPTGVSLRYFQYYKLLYWSGHHLLESIEAGMICRDDYAFRVVFSGDLTRGKILRNPDAQYALSFRLPNLEWSIDPVVIISSASK